MLCALPSSLTDFLPIRSRRPLILRASSGREPSLATVLQALMRDAVSSAHPLLHGDARMTVARRAGGGLEHAAADPGSLHAS